MSGITPLVDTLLATRLAQRPDLVPLKSQVEIAGPGVVAGAEKVINDVRLPSRAALERSLGMWLSASDDGHPGLLPAGHGQAVSLSTAARAIAAILGPQTGASVKVRGSEPLWSLPRPPSAQLLVATLADAVGYSGLFYESHLQQFVAGERPLAQLVREPQAGLLPVDPASAPAEEGQPPLAAGRSGAAGGPTSFSIPAAAQSVSAGGSVPGDPAYPATVYERDGTTGNQAPRFHQIAGQAPNADMPAAAAPDSSNSVAASIHPDAMGLVRQQLELLAVPVFRWGGDAWPGVSMDWDIHEEPERNLTDGGDEASPPAWTTRLSMTLPALKSVDVCLTLAGDTLQVRLEAAQEATLSMLAVGREALRGRLDALGLHVTDLQIDASEPHRATDAQS